VFIGHYEGKVILRVVDRMLFHFQHRGHTERF
jgi:hypothetical protein